MFKVENITKDWKEAGSLQAHINLYGFWDEHCFLTKTGDLGMALKIGGIDYESLDHTGRDYAVKRLEAAFRNRSIKKAKDTDSIPKLLSAYIRKADEGELGRLLVEMVILTAARTQQDGGRMLKEAAEYYKVDTDAITLKVKQELAARQKAQAAKKINPKTQPKPAKKPTAA